MGRQCDCKSDGEEAQAEEEAAILPASFAQKMYETVGANRLPNACRTGINALTSLSPATCTQPTHASEPTSLPLLKPGSLHDLLFGFRTHRLSDSLHYFRGVLLQLRTVGEVRFICRAVLESSLKGSHQRARCIIALAARQQVAGCVRPFSTNDFAAGWRRSASA